jgi:hypothetical protein
MGTWNDYKPEESTSKIGAGNYRCAVVDVEETISKTSQKPMIVITVLVNGTSIKVKHYIVKNEYFNRNITSFFDSFGIERGDFNFPGWIGAIGAAKFIEDDNGYLKVKFWLNEKQAENLPVWSSKIPERQTVTEIEEPTVDDDLPF